MTQFRSAIKGAPRQRRHRTDVEYWEFVHELMELGWYRMGEGRDPSGAAWGFRSGHTLRPRTRDGARTVKPEQRPSERWIVAKTETAAMRRLLHELRGETPNHDSHAESQETLEAPQV